MSETDELVATVALLAIPIALFALFGFLIWRSMRGATVAAVARNEADLAERRARARPGTAKVVASDVSPSELRDQHGFGVYRVVSLTLDVTGDERAYAATAVWDVQLTAMPHVAPGAPVSVLIDADDPLRVYPSEAWARTGSG